MSGESQSSSSCRRRGRPPKDNPLRILAAIEGSQASRSVIAARCGMTLVTLGKYIDKYPAVAEAIDAEARKLCDAAECRLYDNVLAGDQRAIEFFLERRMPEKYGKKSPDVQVNNVQLDIQAFFDGARKSWRPDQ